MARRIVRTLLQLSSLSVLLGAAVFLLDLRYRVLPTKIHYLLPEHHADNLVTDLTLVQCSTIQLITSCGLSSDEGWKKVPKDVFLGQSFLQQGFVHVQTKHESSFTQTAGDKVVVDVKVGRIKPDPSEGAGEKDVEWESRPGGIWIKRQAKLMDSAVSAVDVLFGADAVEVRPGWQLKEGSMNVGEVPRLTVRRGPPVEAKKPVVRMRRDHKLKIIQVSDLHLSTGVGKCRDAQPPSSKAGCEADFRTLNFIRRILDDEKPDLAILSGDQVNGDTAPDAQTAVFKFADPFIERKIPYATILGNHDDEGNLSREQIMALTASLPYSLSEVGPLMGDVIKDKKGREQHEGGAGNYRVEVLAHSNDHSALTIYLLDTHSYSPDRKVDGYDWVKDYQIDWFKKTTESLRGAHSKYTYMHLNMAFIHIPLPEYRLAGFRMVGEHRESPTSPAHNSGFKRALVEAGVGIVSAGHDHVNDYCLADDVSPKIWMCYAGGSGFGGYGGYGGYHRRVRIFEVDAPADRIKTWKRLEYEDQGPFDVQTIVEGGRAVAPRE